MCFQPQESLPVRIPYLPGDRVNSEGEQLRLPASPSLGGHEPEICDQEGIPPWNPQTDLFPRG